jgi:hypothetical protein
MRLRSCGEVIWVRAKKRLTPSGSAALPSARCTRCRTALADFHGVDGHAATQRASRLTGAGSRPMRRSVRWRLYPMNSSSPPSPERTTFTCSRATCDRYQVGTAEGSANGSP